MRLFDLLGRCRALGREPGARYQQRGQRGGSRKHKSEERGSEGVRFRDGDGYQQGADDRAGLVERRMQAESPAVADRGRGLR